MMASGVDGFKPCMLCARTCFESHGDQGRAEAEEVLGGPSFLTLIGDTNLPNNSGLVRLPSMFMEDHGHRIGDVVTLKGPSGWAGQVNVSYDRGFGFRGGWKQFGMHHNVEAGDHIVCTLIANSKFTVKIYNKYGCEKKVLPSSAPNVEASTAEKGKENASDLLTQRTSEGGHQSSPAKLGGKRKTQDEVESLSGIGKKLCMQQLGLENAGAGNGNAEVEIEDQKRKLKEMLEKSRSRLDHDGDHQSPEESEENKIHTAAQEGPRSEECSSSDSEKKSTEMEDGDDDVRVRRKRAHNAVYETEMKRFMAMEAAQAYETANPSTMLVVNKTAFTKRQSYFSSVFARKWFPEEKTQLLLMDEAENKWPVTFIPTTSHMILGAGWAKFVRDNKLEKGDVVVFELKNPNSLTLLVHIFRVKDYTFVKSVSVGNTRMVEIGAVPTVSMMDPLISNSVEDRMTGIRKDNQPTGTSETTGSKSPQPPMLPQYAALAKYFANRSSPVLDNNPRAGNGGNQEAEPPMPNEASIRRDGSGATLRQGEPFAVPKQGLSFMMLLQGGCPVRVSPPGEREIRSAELSESRSLFPAQSSQGTQQGGPSMVVLAEPSASKSFFPPWPQQVQFVLTQQGQIPYMMPPQLGGTIVLAPHGQVPYMVQEGAPFVKLQPVVPPPTPTPRQEDDPHGVPLPPGLPKEAEFPKPVKEEPTGRVRDRWEVKPRRPRPPTDTERQRAMDEAFEFWTPNPHVMVALKPSQVYAGFSLTLRLAALPDETRDATLVDSTGRTWLCKWLVNQSGRRLSAGWKRFAVDHLLEEGDVCVFEMLDRVNLTLLIHIFRIELDDHPGGPALEVRKSEEGRRFTNPVRIRKSRAKPNILGPPLPKMPAYSGCRMEKLGGSAPPLGRANVLPTMPSYKYTALQSQRRPVTMEERRKAELAARNLSTKNPSVTIVMRNSSVYCHFLVSIPSAFAKQWLPRKLVRVTLCDVGGQKVTARWAGNRKKSACLKSFREFSLSHCLEEGDALVFELLDANPNNPVFLVHVFRVVELPNRRIALKDWENHYKLDVMIGTVKAVPLQEVDGDSGVLQEYHTLSDSDEETDEHSQAPRPPAMRAQLSPKSKMKAIYSAILRRKTIGSGESVHSESVHIDLEEGPSHRPDNATHSAQGHPDLYADKATHISQLERLGRQQIARDIMPLLKRKPPSAADGMVHEFDSGNHHSAQAHGEHLNNYANRAGTEAAAHGAQSENGTNEVVVHNVMPLVTRIPKTEPVDDVSPVKERTKVRRKTTQRREAGQDDFLRITLGDASVLEPEDTSHIQRGSLELNGANACQSETGLCRDAVTLMTRMPKTEPFADVNVPGVNPVLRIQDRQESRQPESRRDGQGAREAETTSIHDRQIIPLPNFSGFDRAAADTGLHWLQSAQHAEPTTRRHPKPELGQADAAAGGCGLTTRRPPDHYVESRQVEAFGPDRGAGSSLVALESATQFSHVFFGSVFDKVGSEMGAHVPDSERKRMPYGRAAARTDPGGDCTYRWQFLSENEFPSAVDEKVQLNSGLPWLTNLGRPRPPGSQVTPARRDDEEMSHTAHDEKLPSEADLNAPHVYMNGFTTPMLDRNETHR